MSNKYEQSSIDDENKVGSDSGEEFYPPETNKDLVVGKVKITFRENRAFELHLNRKVYRFEGRESKTISASELKHKDFTEQMASKFVIQEVK